MHYQRAYVDRDSASDGGPIRFIAATEGRKGDGIDLRMSGARLDRFIANPIFGYGHRYYSRQDLPIGRATRTEIDGARLLIDVEFDQGDEFAREVERKYRDGFMNAVSIGFDVAEWEGGKGSYWAGGVAVAWELTELSAVPVPMDGLAVVESGRARGLDLRELLAALPAADPSVQVDVADGFRTIRVTDGLIETADPLALPLALARALATAPAPAPQPAPIPTAPNPAAIDAARALLAVLTPKEIA